MGLSGFKVLAFTLLVFFSRFLQGPLGCFADAEEAKQVANGVAAAPQLEAATGSLREEAEQQLGNGAAVALQRRQSRSRSALALHGRGQGAVVARRSGSATASAFSAVAPPSDAAGDGLRPRKEEEHGRAPAFGSVARKLLHGADTNASSKPSCQSNHVGCRR